MTLDFPTRLRWLPSHRALVAHLGALAWIVVHDLGDGRWQWRSSIGTGLSTPTDLRTAILAAEDEAIDLLCGALASLNPLPNDMRRI